MKKNRVICILMAVVIIFTVTACKGNGETQYPTQIVNGGFEHGVNSLQGWTRTGAAFSVDGVVAKKNLNGSDAFVTGEYFFSGRDSGNQQFSGTLVSDFFKLTGTGKIAFQLGAGKDSSKCYVEFFEKDNTTALHKAVNDSYNEPYILDQMIRQVVDLSAHVNKILYIKITDNDKTDDFAYLNFDDFKVLQTQSEVDSMLSERQAQLAAIAAPEFEENESNTTLSNGGFEEGLKNWKVLSGTAFTNVVIADSTDTFWSDERDFLAVGDKFLNGFNTAETAIGTMRSEKFTLAGDGFISFMIGGCFETADIFVSIHDASDDSQLIKFNNDKFHDPYMALNLHRVYIDASDYVGDVLYIKITDNAAAGPFGAITVDDFIVSMTDAEVKSLMKSTFEGANALADTAANKYIKDYYRNYEYLFELEVLRLSGEVNNKSLKSAASSAVNLNSYLSEATAVYGVQNVSSDNFSIVKVAKGEQEWNTGFGAFDMTELGIYKVYYQAEHLGMTAESYFYVEIINDNMVSNGGFELGDLTGWTVLTPDTLNSEGAIDDSVYFWNEKIPFNKGGTYFFSGWGAQYNEADAYSFKSTNFVLSGSGFVSFRMGGAQAIVEAYLADGTKIGEYRNTAFADVSFPNVDEGCRLATMTTFVADLSGHLGEEMYIVLKDGGWGGWGVAFFDEIVTYYATAPVVAEMSDAVTIYKGEESSTYNIAWETATNLVTNDPIIEAFAPYTKGGVNISTSVNLKGGTFESVSGNGITVSDYSFANSALTIFATYLDTLAADVHSFVLQTDKGSVNFSIAVSNAQSIVNGGFETGDLTGWTVVDGNVITQDAIFDEYNFWVEKIPFNKGGTYFFNGWTAQPDEAQGYAIKSTNFVLSGSGFVSFRMGGAQAIVEAYLADGTKIGEYRNTAFADVSFPNVDEGCRLATMTTFVADLSGHLGEEMYIVLKDGGGGGWGVAFFDEIVTYYATAPVVAEMSDAVTICKGEESSTYNIAWETAVNELAP